MRIDQAIRQNLLAVAQAYGEATGLAQSTISRQFYGNRDFFAELAAEERSVTTDKLADMLQAFSDRWPPGTAWPAMQAVSMRRPPRVKKSTAK